MADLPSASDCCGCSACAQACPRGCITMRSDTEGFAYPVVDEVRCTHCRRCEAACPVLHVASEPELDRTEAYAAMAEDAAMRLQSSSGGMFSLFAESILHEGGAVFGAALDDDQAVRHACVTSEKELPRLRGSKYVQSDVGTCFVQVKECLDRGRKVLFSGTPCQVEGLLRFLGRPYDGLYVIDLICHGVPSPKAWREYVAFREARAGSRIRQTSFRHKQYGWKRYAVSFLFEDDTAYLGPLDRDPYMRAFLSDICLRPSCGACRFKTIRRRADVTLADFWGIGNVCPEMDDDKGTSLVIVHSDKGRRMLDDVRSRCRLRAVDVQAAVGCNTAMTRSAVFHPRREDFLKALGTTDFDRLVRRYCGRPVTFRSVVRGVLSTLGLLGVARRIRALARRGGDTETSIGSDGSEKQKQG